MKTAAEPEPRAVEAVHEVDSGTSSRAAHPPAPAQASLTDPTVYFLQRSLGNRVTRRTLASIVLQPKLTVGAPDDAYEREADAVAEQVLARTSLAAAGTSNSDDDDQDRGKVARKSANSRCAQHDLLRRVPVHTLQQTLGNRALARLLETAASASVSPVISRKCACGSEGEEECAECSKKRLGLQRSTIGKDGRGEAPPIVEQVLATSGQPLAESARKTLEPGFGHDFSGVRVHDDSKAAESAAAVSALAYTVGNHIVFGAGQYSPGTSDGNRLLAHELTHTIQQTAGKPKEVAGKANDPLESEEEHPVDRVMLMLDPKIQRYGHANSCTEKDHLAPYIWPGHAQAKVCVGKAIDVTDGRPLTPDASRNLVTFFGKDSTNSANLPKINANFKKISSALDSQYLYHCSKKGDSSDKDAITCKGQNAETARSGNKDVTLCFDDLSKWSVWWAAWLIIHENVHRGLDVWGHSWEAGSLDHCINNNGALSGSQLDLNNADSYACFAVSVCLQSNSADSGKELQRSTKIYGAASSASLGTGVSSSEFRALNGAEHILPSTSVGRKLIQRDIDTPDQQVSQPQESSPSAGGGQSLPAGAPATFVDDFDPVAEDATKPSQSGNDTLVQPSIQRSVESSEAIQRQTGPTTPKSGAPPPVVASSLSWSDYHEVPNQIDGFSANTSVKRSWRNDGTGFNATFNPAGSWSVKADQTDTLLRHEQYHLNLAVLMANKANAAAGTMSASALIRAFEKAVTTHDRSYDQDTDHSRNAALQAMWEKDIDAGIPEFPIT